MKPPTSGPITGPSTLGMLTQVMAAMNSLRGKLRSRISRPTGVIMAPPMPCRKRLATSIGRFRLTPQATEPRVNTAIAVQKMRRMPNRSAIQPDTGMKMASARM